MILVVVLCFLAAAYAAPVDVPTIISYENNNDGLGRYNFAFQTSDGTKRQEQSEVINAGDPEKESLIVRGSFSYIGPDGVTYTVTYTADENGFQPSGDHFPTSPQLIAASLLQTVDKRDDWFFTYDPPVLISSLLG